MRLIGAGLPRTATLSQKIALEMLGLAPCYHMVTVLADLPLAEKWDAMLDGSSDWDSILGGFEATVDWPGSFFYQELMVAYPDAKVLLSVRDAEAWERSMTDTIYSILHGDSMTHDLSSAWSRVDPAWNRYLTFINRLWDKSGLLPNTGAEPPPGFMAEGMERYNAEVISTVPADRLLVWRATDGWEPLCEFLELPVPDAPFPRVNDSKMFDGRIVDAALGALNAWRAEQQAAANAS